MEKEIGWVKEVTIDGVKIKVREFTPVDVRASLKAAANKTDDDSENDLADSYSFEGLLPEDVARMTSLVVSDIEKLRLSSLKELIAACKEVNEVFFGMRRDLEERGRVILEESSQSHLASLKKPASL